MTFNRFGLVLIFIGFSNLVFADDANVLPEGRWRLRLVGAYAEASNQLGASGDVQSLGARYSRNLDASFLQILSPSTRQVVQALNSISPGQGDSFAAATLDTSVDSQFFTNLLVAEYGLTERISVGIILPIVHADISVSATSNASNQMNQLLQQPDLPENHPMYAKMAQLKAALRQIKQGTTVAGLNSTLQGQLGYSSGLSSWSSTGIGDIEVGGKINYFKSHPIRMTVKAGATLPTGREDDPDILTDCAFGSGQFAVGAYNYVDYQPFANTYFTLETGYTNQLPGSTIVRAPLSSDVPIGSDKVQADRKLGDYFEAGFEANQTLYKYFTASAKYRFKQKFKDSYSAPSADLSSLEIDTDSLLHEVIATVEYTNLPAVRAGTATIPYALGGFYRQPFAGKNITDVRTTGMFVKTYF